MAGTEIITNHGLSRSSGGHHRGRLRYLRALAKGLQRILGRTTNRGSKLQCAAGLESATDTRVVTAAGNLRDTRVLQVLHRRCEEALNPGRRCVAVNLTNVTDADTKLVAALIVLLQRARSMGVPLDVSVSDGVYDWIKLYRVERLLQPCCVQSRPVPGHVLRKTERPSLRRIAHNVTQYRG
jgi:ABC-type transporter Mla MlaB component